MANMSYVRFENTLRDLRDCYEHIDDTDLSDEEERSRRALLKLCFQIADDYGDDSDAEMLAEIGRLRDEVRSARDDEARRWAGRVDAKTAQLLDMDARYMALLNAVADGVAMQPMTLTLSLQPDAGNAP